MGIFDRLAQFAGETVRIKANANKEKSLDPQMRQWINGLIQRAENGDTNAMLEIGGYYFKGEYVGYDPQRACFWWTEAAKLGCVSAQYNLGLLYDGEISTYFYDENLAGYWFNMAAYNGDQEAYKMLQSYRYSEFRKKWVKR